MLILLFAFASNVFICMYYNVLQNKLTHSHNMVVAVMRTVHTYCTNTQFMSN